ncbi:Uncharacterised protein [Actinobacillus pleuropneumoniae]|nr:Uncharacterised protein [Actinobacillus pleuropneumoniae]
MGQKCVSLQQSNDDGHSQEGGIHIVMVKT